MITSTPSLPASASAAKNGQSAQVTKSSNFARSAATAETVSSIGVSRQELRAAYQLIYTKYVGAGLISERPGRVVYHPAFGLSTSRTLVARTRQQPDWIVGTLSVVGDSPLGLSVEQTYPEAVRQLRQQGRHLVEATCLAIWDGEQKGIPVFFSLTQFAIQYAMWSGYDDLLLTVHPRHARFYQRCFRAEPIGPPRNHRLVSNRPALACRIDLHLVDQVVDPTVRESYLGRKIAACEFAAGPISEADHKYFCSLLDSATDRSAA